MVEEIIINDVKGEWRFHPLFDEVELYLARDLQ